MESWKKEFEKVRQAVKESVSVERGGKPSGGKVDMVKLSKAIQIDYNTALRFYKSGSNIGSHTFCKILSWVGGEINIPHKSSKCLRELENISPEIPGASIVANKMIEIINSQRDEVIPENSSLAQVVSACYESRLNFGEVYRNALEIVAPEIAGMAMAAEKKPAPYNSTKKGSGTNQNCG